MQESHPGPWTYETQYISAERKGTTGKFTIRDRNHAFVCEADSEVLAKNICALPEMIDAVNQLLEDAVKHNRQEHRVTNYSINLARAAKARTT